MKTSKAKPLGDKRTASKEAAAVFPKDLDHYDAMTVLRDRLLGLSCAINGASIAEAHDRNGLQQLMADVVGSFEVLREVFGRERGLQTQRNESHDAKIKERLRATGLQRRTEHC